MDGPIPPPIQLVPGQPPTQAQIQAIRAHMEQDAQRLGLSMEEYVNKLREAQAQAQAQQGGHVHGPNCNHDHDHGPGNAPQQAGHQPVQPGPPKPEALAVAGFLRKQNLKIRTCLLQEQRKDMFRVKRAIRSLQSDAYKKARTKNKLLPEVTDRNSAEAVFKLLPMSFLALRVQKLEDGDEAGHEGHGHGKKKRVKGLWNVQVVPQQDASDDMYYMWLYEGPAWVQQAYAIGALALVMTLVMFPLWPLVLRQGAWYLSMAFFGLIVLFFVMAIFRLILFCITMFTHPPGLWLFPNLFEDVGFVESFIPLWAWQEDKKAVRKAKRLERQQKSAARAQKAAAKANGNGAAAAEDNDEDYVTEDDDAEELATPGSDVAASGVDTGSGSATQRSFKVTVEEAEDE